MGRIPDWTPQVYDPREVQVGALGRLAAWPRLRVRGLQREGWGHRGRTRHRGWGLRVQAREEAATPSASESGRAGSRPLG